MQSADMRMFRRLRLVSVVDLCISRYVTVRVYLHANALTRRMWNNMAPSTHPDMRECRGPECSNYHK